MELGALLSKLNKVKKSGDKYMSLCPSHQDTDLSLSITSDKEKILVHCFAGCTAEAIVKSLGLELTDLFLTQRTAKPRIVKTYDYTDETGKVLFQVCRLEPKSFRQRHKDGSGEWVWSTKDIRKVLYHLPDIIRAPKVYFVEGEKDADNLCDCGLVATTSPGGAKSWKDSYIEPLIGKKVVLIPDMDDAGVAYGREIAFALMGKAQLSCILLPVKDVSDWILTRKPTSKEAQLEQDIIGDLEKMEQDISALLGGKHPSYELVDDAIVWQHTPVQFKAENIRRERTGLHSKLTILHKYQPLAWSVFNIERSEERIKLAKLAFTHLKPEVKNEYHEESLKQDLDLFCADLWGFYLSHYTPELVYGTEKIAPLVFFLKPYIMQGGGTIMFAPPGRGKALDDNTPIFTIQGWKRHGDLVVGNYIFGIDGKPKRVLAIRKVDPNRPNALITFDNGAQIVADIEHEWLVWCDREKYRVKKRHIKRPSVRKCEILETGDLLTGQRRSPAIELAAALELPYQLLPIDPYILGVWLGDGSRGTGYITSGDKDIEHFKLIGEAHNERPGYWRIVVPGLHKQLRLLGILTEKYIPEIYYLSSFAQRLSLLQGIMDTDGSIDREGRCELTTVSERLAHCYKKLISSLSIKASCRESDAKLNGRIVSKRYRLNFYPPDGLAVFTLVRKSERQKPTVGNMTRYNYVKSVEPVSSRPMQCIEVEGGIYLAGEDLIPTHNSNTALLWAQSVNSGVSKYWPVKQAPVLFINLERSRKTIERRLSCINKILGLPAVTPLRILNARGKSLNDVFDGCRRAVKQYDIQIIILDSISRSGFGDLTENKPVNAIVDTLSGLCETWVALAHTPRVDETHIYGGVMFDAGADIVVKLSSVISTNGTLGIGYEITKANDITYGPLRSYAMEFGETGLCNFRDAKPYEFPELEGQIKKPMIQAITDYLLEQDRGDATASEIAEALNLNRGNAANVLSRSGKFVKTRTEGRNVYYGVKETTKIG